jgi:hypothetical protein
LRNAVISYSRLTSKKVSWEDNFNFHRFSMAVIWTPYYFSRFVITGQEVELCHMILDCCAQQRTYEKFFGLLAGRFCALNIKYVVPFEGIFKDTYDTGTILSLPTNISCKTKVFIIFS